MGIIKIQLNTREPGIISEVLGPGSRSSFVASGATIAARSIDILFTSVIDYRLTRKKRRAIICTEQY